MPVKLHKDVTAHLKVVIEKEAVAEYSEAGGSCRPFSRAYGTGFDTGANSRH